ncbi:MAG TPA: hypothetical protein PLQ45_00620 [Anaerohalosphaeraceae bacterium]|jgi:hypothetical protein|nr:hypothetical protein [Anaerohalosphaeraceae bacterium]
MNEKKQYTGDQFYGSEKENSQKRRPKTCPKGQPQRQAENAQNGCSQSRQDIEQEQEDNSSKKKPRCRKKENFFREGQGIRENPAICR